MGWCYLNGVGAERDYEKALEHFTQLEEPSARARYNLGRMYRMGYGCKLDYAKAFEYFMSAAEEEEASAQMAIGRAFYRGEGISENNEEAVKWFTLAHENGDNEATYYLGECLYNGYGIQENEEEAIVLLQQAAEQDNQNALSLLQVIGVDLQQYSNNDNEKDSVVQLHADLEVRARTLYSKTVTTHKSKTNEIDKGRVVSLEETKRAKLDLIMASNEEHD